jgi:hypothetical protein
MFLLEPIDDAALLEQVTSRADGLGAAASVEIKTVNTLYEGSDALQGALDKLDVDEKEASGLLQERDKVMNKVVCDFSYREFESKALAEEHETKCQRNPNDINHVGQFESSKVHRYIRTPAVKMASVEDTHSHST